MSDHDQLPTLAVASHMARGAALSIKTAGHALAEATAIEDALALKRGAMKAAALKELIGKPNPLSEGKVHSASSAEAFVDEHGMYAAFRREQTEAVVRRIGAQADYDCALRLADRANHLLSAAVVAERINALNAVASAFGHRAPDTTG